MMRVLLKMNYAKKCFLEFPGSYFTLFRAVLGQAIVALLLSVFAANTMAEKGDGILDPARTARQS
jgi:hypothetical protein